jgi:hypothetical protein
MSVDIDKAGRDEKSGGVDFAPARASLATDTGDLAAIDRDVANESGLTGTIDDFAIADYEVMHTLGSS